MGERVGSQLSDAAGAAFAELAPRRELGAALALRYHGPSHCTTALGAPRGFLFATARDNQTGASRLGTKGSGSAVSRGGDAGYSQRGVRECWTPRARGAGVPLRAQTFGWRERIEATALPTRSSFGRLRHSHVPSAPSAPGPRAHAGAFSASDSAARALADPRADPNERRRPPREVARAAPS